nr:MAG TPA: distal tail protein [Caudoviricetes sp.]
MSYKTLNLDLAKTPILKSIVYGRIGDEDMQTVAVNITSRDTPVDLTGFTITFEGITSGGQTKVFDVDGISKTDAGLKSGTFDYTFPNMAFAVAGNYEIAYFSIVKGDKRDTTGEFDIIVDGNADIDAPLAETIITEYNKLVKELHQITDKYISDSDAKFADLNKKIADLQTKITQYQNMVKNTADTAVSTINTTKDSAVSTINSTKDSAVNMVNTAASSAVKTINDALEEFKKGDFYTKAEADAKFATIQSLTDLSTKVIANKGNLASGTDLDNVIDIGTYRIGGLTGGTDIINVPSERSGTTIYAYVTVSGTTTSVVQELIVYDSKTVSQIYSRSRSGSTPTFSPWSKTVMADDSGKATIKDLVVTGTIQQTLSVNQSIAVGWGRTLNFTRIGNVVTVTGEGTFATTMLQGAWQSAGETLPVGFRPLSRQTTRASTITNVNKFMWTRFNTDGSIQHWQNGSIVVTDTMIMNGTSWVTADPFPTA